MAGLGQAGLLLGRRLLALLFLHEAWVKITGYERAVAYTEEHGVPGIMLPAAIALEPVGGLLIAIGLGTLVLAFLLSGFCLVTPPIFHTEFSAPGQLPHFEKDLSIAGAFLVLCFHGGGAWSLDQRWTAAKSIRSRARWARSGPRRKYAGPRRV